MLKHHSLSNLQLAFFSSWELDFKQLRDYEDTGPVGPYPLRFLAESPFPIEFYKLGQVTVERLQVRFPMPGTDPTSTTGNGVHRPP